MNRKELAAALGISGAMVSRLAKRGMPVDSKERAARWRSRNLEPARMKGSRIDTMQHAAPARPTAAGAGAGAIEAAARAQRLGGLALDAGAFDLAEGELRAALRAVPSSMRAAVVLDARVFDALTATVAACLVHGDGSASSEAPPPPSELNDDEAASMGAFWYAAACGEVVATPAG